MAGVPTAADASAVREQVEQIKQRLASDPTFVQRLVQNPRETLETVGIPSNAVNEVINAPTEEGVAPACFFSCITTNCCFTVSVCCNTGSC